MWPKKTREFQTALVDSTRWNGFRFREGDIVVATWGKSGTTWMEQIVSQLVLDARAGLLPGAGGWVELRVVPLDQMRERLEAQTHRRYLKTHLPIDALVFSPIAKYIYVGRDARDIVWSAYNHHAGYTQTALDAFNNLPGRVGPPLARPDCDVREYYRRFLDTGDMPGFGLAPFWSHVQGWWDVRRLPNVLLVHFNNLKADMPQEIRRVASFLDIRIDEALRPAVIEHCSFDYMRNAAREDSVFDRLWQAGRDTFFHRGTNGRWKDVLSEEEIRRCDEIAGRRLSPDCARWLGTGELAD